MQERTSSSGLDEHPGAGAASTSPRHSRLKQLSDLPGHGRYRRIVVVTRVKQFVVKPMTAEEAVLQMESLGHDFYLFVNPESEQAGVVYRRSDGSFGLIEPA